MTEQSWGKYAACHGMDPRIFWGEDPTLDLDAKDVCRTCPALKACHDWAHAHPRESGQCVWGGQTRKERNTERRRNYLARRKDAA